MNVNSFTDASGNRKLTMIDYNIPFHGKERINIYADFTAGRMTKSVPGMDFCWEFDLGEKINLREWIDKFLDPKGGITTYLGTKDVDWANTKYHAFKMVINTKEIQKTAVLYFDMNTLELQWIEMVKPLFFVIQVDNGL